MKKKKKLSKEEEEMIYDYWFPIEYKGKLYFKKDCDELFLCYYHPNALNENKGVYAQDNIIIYPDGEWEV